MAQSGPNMTSNGPKWPKIALNDPRMTQNDPKWPKITPNDPKMMPVFTHYFRQKIDLKGGFANFFAFRMYGSG